MDEDGIKLTSYFSERRRVDGRFVADALIDTYGHSKIASSVVLRGSEGFGVNRRLRTNHSLSLSEDLPLTAIAVDTRAVIGAVLDQTRDINDKGLTTVERTRFLSGDIEPIALPETAGDEAALLTVYFCRQDTVFGVPAFEVMCELLHRRNIGGATALAGVDGTARGRRQRAHFFGRNADLPMMVVTVGASKSVGAVVPEVADLLRDPHMTLQQVRICKRDGELINEPDTPPPYDDGLPLWQKLTVYASEDTRQGGRPIHRMLIRRLLSSGISGATTQCGVWGFRGDHTPHGDQRHLPFGHHVPAVTTVIETPQRIPTAFGIIDELTSEHGLVTWATVPVIRPATGR